MPVTVYPCSNTINRVGLDSSAHPPSHYIKDPFSILPRDASLQQRKGPIYQSSFSKPTSSSLDENEVITTAGMSNGLVSAAFRAYSSHHHLVLRPDDLWIAILTQFNYFANAKENTDTIRRLVVGTDEGLAPGSKKELIVTSFGDRFSMDAGQMAIQLTKLIQGHIIDPHMRDWIMPNFTTTTENDRIISSVIMMSTFKEFFNYTMYTLCGLPAVTLMGERADYEIMLSKIEKLTEFGTETTQWRDLLHQVLLGFINTFDQPEADTTKTFWSKIAHKNNNGSGASYLSGWLTAFCYFDSKGQSLYGPGRNTGTRYENLVLGDATFHLVDTNKVPPAYAEVPVTVKDNGVDYKTVMVAGLVGNRVTGEKMDTLQPQPAWWIAQVGEGASMRREA